MKVTSQLALSQVKLNKKRTIGTVFAIALSTAIVTALMCFATSANRMITGFFGGGYGEYFSLYTMIVAVPVGLLCLLIAFMSITCISNIFAASANKRIQEFGIIKCVGGTKKQIKDIVVFESLWISMVGIPIGLLCGTLFGFIGVSITSHYVTEFNDLARSIIMRPYEANLSFSISGWTYLFASVVSFLIVIRSASKPAKTVGKITAIQSIKGLGANYKMNNATVHSGLVEKIFGYEGVVGLMNIKRNKAGYKATIRSLALGLILLILLGGMSSQAEDFAEWMTPDSKEMLVDFTSARDYEIMPNGEEKETYVVPIVAETYNEIRNRLDEFDENEVYGIGSDAITYQGIIDKEYLNPELLTIDGLTDSEGKRHVNLVATDDFLYEKLCARAGVPVGSNLIINDFGYNDQGTWKTFRPYKENLNQITLVTAEGETTTLSIDGMLTEEDLIEKGFAEAMPDSVRIVVPRATARYFDWYCLTEDEQGFNEYARKVLDEYYPILTEDSYLEQGYTVRISRTDNMSKVINMAIVMVEFVMYGFVILLMMIGFTSVISTLVTNIRIRSREFSVLKSVGMTKGALKKMVWCESMFCLTKAIIPGVFFGLLIPYGMNLAIRQVFPVLFHIPWVNIVVGVVVVTVVVMGITSVEMERLRDKNIIDEIRMDVM